MSDQERTTLLRVGIFMAIGLFVIGAMVVYFGRFGDAVRGYYPLTAEFADASGIYKGASVLLAGAKVGMVESNPEILPNMDGVSVRLKIYENVEIPSKSEFLVGSSGLLGDKFVQIVLGPDAKASPPIKPDTVIKGKTESGIADIAKRADALLADIQKAVGSINSIAEKLDSDVFQESTMANLNLTIANLKQTTESFAESAKKVDGVIAKAEGAIGTGEGALTAAKSAAESAQAATEELKKILTDVRGIVQQTKQGRGTLGALLVDRKMAENLKALVANMRRSGVLFYKDRAESGGER
jgi:phospholipid/cholesterol/gamma-HCH transport system substrate-binding protein